MVHAELRQSKDWKSPKIKLAWQGTVVFPEFVVEAILAELFETCHLGIGFCYGVTSSIPSSTSLIPSKNRSVCIVESHIQF